MVTVGVVKYNICIGSLSREQLSAVEGSVDEANLGVLCRNFGTLIAVANKCGDLKVWISVCYGVEGVASDIACSASASSCLVGYMKPGRPSGLT
jgi:hypothetical protein